MKSNFVLLALILLLSTSSFVCASENELARDSEPLIVIVTLSGSMIAVDPKSSHVRWFKQFDPVLRTGNQGASNLNSSSIFLPDPVSGSLYSMKQNPHDEFSYELEKMSHSIPDLAIKAPFRSPEENILYTGRKSDSWFIINSKTGECKNVFDFNHNEESTDLMPMSKLHDVYIGRTQYDVCMANMNPTSRNKEVWNVSMYQYNAFEMNEDIIDKYEFVHIVSSSTGKILTLTKQSGDVLWRKSDLNSPVVALFLMGKNGFLNIPFTSVDDRVFETLSEPAKQDRLNVHLRETVYIGKNKSAASTIFYAIPSYIDDQTYIITKQSIGSIGDPEMIPGHYVLSSKDIPLIAHNNSDANKPQNQQQQDRNNSAAVQEAKDDKIDSQITFSMAYAAIFGGSILIVTVVFMTLQSRNSRFNRVLKQESQNSTRSNLSDRDDFPPTIGKITFDPHDLLGKGSEGTSVYRGSFDNRTVAVKRLLVDCFGIADKEVRMLRESDNHENIIRYFCTEFDREFCYIAVELCSCTLHDYAVNDDFAFLKDLIKPKEMLYQATRGLSHLHQLHIIHRDIKPQNILLSMPDSRNNVRALISDFGLCKKVDKDASLSMRTNAAGTEGWIAPETLRNEKLSKSVDIFSLGCVFYYTLTSGNHPFGEVLHRQSNILSHIFTLNFHLPSAFDWEYEKILAHELIADMLKQQNRPTCDAVLKHPLFWSDSKMLDFMQVISDRVERLDTSDDPLWSLERNARMIVREDWKEVLEAEIVNDLGKQRTYHGISVRDLMRAIRNKRNHYNELTEEVKRMLGSIPIDYCKFWLTRFPHLPSHAYHVMQMCSRESTFGRFYVRYFTFTKPSYLFDKSLDNHELVELQKRVKIENATANSKKWFEQKQGGQQSNGWSYVNNSKSKRGFYNFKMKNSGGGGGGNIERRGSGGSNSKECDE